MTCTLKIQLTIILPVTNLSTKKKKFCKKLNKLIPYKQQ